MTDSSPGRAYWREVRRSAEYWFAPSIVTFVAVALIWGGRGTGNDVALWTGMTLWAVSLVVRMVEMFRHPERVDAWHNTGVKK